MEGKWTSLSGEGYRLEDLGRPAIFLIPTKKLKIKIGEVTVEDGLHGFLTQNFGAYTSSTVPSFGFWKSSGEAVIFDECREYEVSFLGKEKLPFLLKKLAEIAIIINEDCLYIKAGQYSALLYPES